MKEINILSILPVCFKILRGVEKLRSLKVKIFWEWNQKEFRRLFLF